MVSTYIHLNPFRAKLAGEGCERKLEKYQWSSYPAYVNKTVDAGRRGEFEKKIKRGCPLFPSVAERTASGE